ncbi:hypothetical protein [Massilia agri]|uniref:Uncharacterized protein n=1 Tax=Massilia agri TaxID=1886785 RepID=A0ABT2AKG0_9BURK|nr:hypothetical protein [Massilia agri]MCS0596717.1 hypothetical protein [Massilia agri]
MKMSLRAVYGFLLGFLTWHAIGVQHANAAEAVAHSVANQYLRCAQTIVRAAGEVQSDGAAGFGVQVDNAPYFFVIKDRVRMSVISTEDGGPLADVLIDQSSADLFAEHIDRRGKYMEELAVRTKTKLDRQKLGSGIEAMTANKPELKGRYVGISLLIDPSKQVVVQWNWIGGRYARVSDVQAFQTSVWKALSPCLTGPES